MIDDVSSASGRSCSVLWVLANELAARLTWSLFGSLNRMIPLSFLVLLIVLEVIQNGMHLLKQQGEKWEMAARQWLVE